MLGAIVTAYSFRRQRREPERFDVRLLRLEVTPQLQSFSPMRRRVPQLTGLQGRALSPTPMSSRSAATSWNCWNCWTATWAARP
jgi:hypothetical protein